MNKIEWELTVPVDNWLRNTQHANITIEGHEDIIKEIGEFLKEKYFVRDRRALGEILSDPKGITKH